MREILFRGRSPMSNKWHYGDLLNTKGDIPPYLPMIVVKGEAFDVEPETVGQFTGLTDKYGCRIFEGDIVMYKDEPGVIQYTDDEAMHSVHFDTWCTDFDHIYPKSVEVVGNIHDNPQLLGGA